MFMLIDHWTSEEHPTKAAAREAERHAIEAEAPGRLPSRDQIRQIRFRTNSFSADNHDAGRVQVEIITRPGLTEWSGNANLGLRTDVLNARNAFARNVGRRIEIGGLVLQRRHAEQHRAQHRADREQQQRQPLMLGLHLLRRSASVSARRIARQLNAVSAPVPSSVAA